MQAISFILQLLRDRTFSPVHGTCREEVEARR